MLRILSVSVLVASCQVMASEGECDLSYWNGLIDENQRVLLQHKLPPNTRVISPDTLVTMDHMPERLNVYINGSRQIDRVSCG